jgi:hypothetical protein
MIDSLHLSRMTATLASVTVDFSSTRAPSPSPATFRQRRPLTLLRWLEQTRVPADRDTYGVTSGTSATWY